MAQDSLKESGHDNLGHTGAEASSGLGAQDVCFGRRSKTENIIRVLLETFKTLACVVVLRLDFTFEV